jgi:hypothetical protein
LTKLSQLADSFHDVRLVCPDGQQTVQALLLAAASPFLASLLVGTGGDSDAILLLPDFSVTEVRQFVRGLLAADWRRSAVVAASASLFSVLVHDAAVIKNEWEEHKAAADGWDKTKEDTNGGDQQHDDKEEMDHDEAADDDDDNESDVDVKVSVVDPNPK